MSENQSIDFEKNTTTVPIPTEQDEPNDKLKDEFNNNEWNDDKFKDESTEEFICERCNNPSTCIGNPGAKPEEIVLVPDELSICVCCRKAICYYCQDSRYENVVCFSCTDSEKEEYDSEDSF